MIFSNILYFYSFIVHLNTRIFHIFTVYIKDFQCLWYFSIGYSPLSQENLRACIGSLIQLQSCPVVHSINIEDIIDDCLHINSVHMAASLLPYLQEGQEKYIRVNTCLFLFYFTFKYVKRLLTILSEVSFYKIIESTNCRE